MIDQRLAIGEGAELILTKDHASFQNVLETINTSGKVLVATFNISKENEELIEMIRQLPKHVKVRLVTNIPGRFPRYYGEVYKEAARKVIRNYFDKLSVSNFTCDIEVYFNFNNHAKLLITDSYGYIGSANFSKESSGNFEAGILITSETKLREIEHHFFNEIVDGSIRFFGGRTEILGFELRQYSKELDEVAKTITVPNQRVIHDIRNQENYGAIQLEDAAIKELESVLWTLEDCLGEITHAMKILSITEQLREDVSQLIRMVSVGSPLDNLAAFNDHDEISERFQSDMENNGENTDEIMQKVTDEVSWERELLNDGASDDLVEVADALSSLCNQLPELVREITMLAKAEKKINNAE